VARIYAGMLGPVALLTSLARGALHAWPAEATLLVAWTSLLAFAALGSVIGWTAERILEEEVRGVMAAGPAGAESKTEPPTAP
jgi:hypothetical protein